MLINTVLSNFYGNDIGHAGQSKPFIHLTPHIIYVSIRFARSKDHIMQIMWSLQIFFAFSGAIAGGGDWRKRKDVPANLLSPQMTAVLVDGLRRQIPHYRPLRRCRLKAQFVDLPHALGAAGGCIDTGSINTAVSQNIRQTDDIFFCIVEGSGKQMAQVMRKYLVFRNTRFPSQPLHCVPSIGSIHRPSRFRPKNISCSNVVSFGIVRKLTTNFLRQQDTALFILAIDHRMSLYGGLHRNIR